MAVKLGLSGMEEPGRARYTWATLCGLAPGHRQVHRQQFAINVVAQTASCCCHTNLLVVLVLSVQNNFRVLLLLVVQQLEWRSSSGFSSGRSSKIVWIK